jgi:hypothetical protein
MTHHLTERQASLLANLLHEIRADWPVESLMTLLIQNSRVPSFPTLVQAALAKALQPTCRTPGAIFQQGQHWSAEVREQMPKPQRCRMHRDFYEPCVCCAADAKAERRPDPYLEEA